MANDMQRSRSAGSMRRNITAALAVLVIAFCAWSMSQYVQGRDPLAWLPGAQGAADVVDGAAREALASAAADTTAATEAREESARTTEAQPVSSNGNKPPVKGKGTAQEVVITRESAEEAAPAESSGEGSAPATSEEAQASTASPAQILVSVTVDASSVGAGSSSAQVALALGATAFDALEATGVAIGTRGFGGGAWVTSIGGVAEDAGHGWTYTVDGSMPSSMSDRCEVHDGSSVVWTYVTTN